MKENTIKIPNEICSVIFITEHKELHDKKLFLDKSGVSRFILGKKEKDISLRGKVLTIQWTNVDRVINLLLMEDGLYKVLFAGNGNSSYIEPFCDSEEIQLTYE